MNIINKRGEITTQHIVILIVLIASFAIILFFLMRLGLGEMTGKEICHNSVVARGSSVLPEESIPLNCHREYVCITSDNTCEQMTKPKKEKVTTKEEVYEVLANEMADCWWMFGEGEVNYVGSDYFPGMYCSICNQVAFDNSLREEIFNTETIDKEDFYNYLANENVSGMDLTYSEYLYGTKDITAIKSLLAEQNSGFGSIDLTKQYYIMMGISSDVNTIGWAATVAGAVAGTLVLIHLAPAAIPIIGGLKIAAMTGLLLTGTGGGSGYFTGVILEGNSGREYFSTSIVEVNSEEFRDLNCKSIATLA